MATLQFVQPWPKGIIPFEIDHNEKKSIMNVFSYIEKVTRLRFILRTSETDYIKLVSGDQNIVVNSQWNPPYPTSDVLGFCPGESRVILKKDPWLALHELGHVIGLIHEHQRSDRDSFLTVDPDDTDPNWIRLKDSENHNLPYNGSSMTHYGLDWQGRNIQWINGLNPGQQWSKFTLSDISSINKIYGWNNPLI